MGTWGPGLYSDDATLDLKPTIATLLRLPLEPDEIVSVLRQREPALADPSDLDYAACWFAVADRFYRYGVKHPPTYALVLSLIEDGVDLKVKAELGMSAADLRRRQRVLDGLAERLRRPNPKPSQRRILKAPQVFLLEVGDIVSFPLMGSRSPNPYFRSWAEENPPFEPDGIGAAVVLDRGRSFDFLAWYTAARLDDSWGQTPSISQCLDAEMRRPGSGTITPTHLKRMRLASIGTVTLNSAAHELLPPQRRSDSTALSDISLSNALEWSSWRKDARGPKLREIVAS